VPGQPRIEGVSVDDRWSRAVPGLTVPPRANRLRIDYTIVDLTSLNVTRFRYRLDGFDSGWVDGAGRRQASYTNLPPGQYAFRLQAAGPASQWDKAEVVWRFSIPPAFYQTRTFYLGCVLGLTLVIAAGWRLRMRKMRKELAAVLNERVRLSREIHDTLLQSLVGVALQLEAASSDALAPQARETLIRMRRQIEQYIREARQSIWNLRSPFLERRDIVTALHDVATQLTAGRLQLAFTVTGEPRPCNSRVATQVLRIAQEALTNALRHAEASRVEMNVTFADGVLQFHVADDGVGFDAELVSRVSGHYGLIGMKERAAEVGGRCTIDTVPGNGVRVLTEIPLACA
jgi:signal transduction histidine kinase